MPAYTYDMAIVQPDEIIAAVLRREAPQWHGRMDAPAIGRFIDAAHYHGVLQLLDAEFRDRVAFAKWPAAVLAACHKATMRQTMYELTHRAELARVFDALAFSGIP